jgi:predicted DNA-binding protein (MmcQ/YjbR family)
MDLAKAAERLRQAALKYPETYEESPWGDRVVKVKGKIFLFCDVHDGIMYVSLKLPQSRHAALKEKWAAPTAYGLGKSGWVSCKFGPKDEVPEEQLATWMGESYRALAPKKLAGSPPALPLASLARGRSAALAAAGPAAAKPVVKAPKIAARALLFCHDKLRARRAKETLAALGVTLDVTDRVADVRTRQKKIDALIIDLGRLAEEGLPLAKEIDATDLPIHLFITGIRDAKQRRRAQTDATSADLFRTPPGDPKTAGAIAATLARYHKKRA